MPGAVLRHRRCDGSARAEEREARCWALLHRVPRLRYYPVNVLNAIKMVPEVCRIYCATANPVEVVVAETNQGRGVLGVIDGFSPKGVEGEDDVAWRKNLLRQFGYKL